MLVKSPHGAGYSWVPERIQQAMTYAEQHGLATPVAASPNYSLAEQIDGHLG